MRRALDEAQSIVAEVNRFGENAIAEKYSEAEDKCKRITSSAKNEASTLLEQLKQLKTDYASARGDFNRKFTVVDKAKEAIQKRDSLEQKLNQYRIGLKGVIDESERESSSRMPFSLPSVICFAIISCSLACLPSDVAADFADI